MRCLFRHGFDLRQEVPPGAGIGKDLNRATALLFFAISSGLPRSDIVSCLLEQGADPCAANSVGSTLPGLLCSKINEYPEALRLLLEAGSPPERLDRAGYGPLHYAAAHNHTGLVKLLLEHGAPIDQRAHDGSFPLLWAACNGRRTVQAELIGEFDAARLSTAREAVKHLPPAWNWAANGPCRGGLSLEAGDGTWHAIAWAGSAGEVVSALSRKYGASRGRSATCLLIRLPELPQQACPPAPWLSPGRNGKLKTGQIMALSYYAPFFPSGIPRTVPSEWIYRFLLASPQDDEKSSHEEQGIASVEIEKIVAFEDGMMLDLPEAECRFDGQKLGLDTPMHY